MSDHPLDDEDVLVTIELQHVETGIEIAKTRFCRGDDRESVQSTVEQLYRAATDELLAKVETRGGS